MVGIGPHHGRPCKKAVEVGVVGGGVRGEVRGVGRVRSGRTMMPT